MTKVENEGLYRGSMAGKYGNSREIREFREFAGYIISHLCSLLLLFLPLLPSAVSHLCELRDLVAFVIFLTSVQTLSGLRQSCRGCPKLPCRIGLRRSGEGAATTPASAHSASPHRELSPPRARIPFKRVSALRR